MEWWLIPSIIGVIIAGIAFGVLVSFIYLRIRKQRFSLLQLQKTFKPGGNGFKPALESNTSYRMVLETAPAIDETRVGSQTAPVRVQQAQPVQTETRTASISVNRKPDSVLSEIEANLAIASRPTSSPLVNYQTDIWNTRRNEFSVLGQEILRDLTEAYVDMLLANNIVWLVTELKRDSKELSSSYFRLSAKVAERLQRAMLAIEKTQS